MLGTESCWKNSCIRDCIRDCCTPTQTAHCAGTAEQRGSVQKCLLGSCLNKEFNSQTSLVSSTLDGGFMSLRLCAAGLGTWWLCFASVLSVRGPPPWQTNSKCISVNGKISGVIASQSLKRKSKLHTINGHQLVAQRLPCAWYSCSQKLCKPRLWQSPQNIPEPKDRLGSMNLISCISFSRR